MGAELACFPGEDSDQGETLDSLGELTARLRDRIVGGLHRGHLHAGDRLPSYREVGRAMGVYPSKAADAYRALEAEGLVEVRPRSGVFVASQERPTGDLLAETQRWMAGVLTEARKRGIKIPEYHELVRRCTASVRVRCACVESTEDAMRVYCAELEESWGFDVQCIRMEPRTAQQGSRGSDFETGQRFPADQLRDVDLIATSSFHAAAVQTVAKELGTPVVVLTTHPDLRAAIEHRLREGALTVVAVDSAFGERVRTVYGEPRGGASVRVILADDRDAIAALDPKEPVLLTRAAHERLGNTDLSLLFPHSPTISPESDRELAEALIQINMERSASPPSEEP